jgi:phenylacetate-CoA ligase
VLRAPRRLAARWLIPLYEGASGRRPWTEAGRLRALQWRPPAELEGRALHKLRPLLAHAQAHVPYYRDLFDRAGLTAGDVRCLGDLARLPVTGKAALRAGFPTEVVADNLPPSRRFLSRTSGSTGIPLEFYTDWTDVDARLGSYLFFWEWAGVEAGDGVAQLVVSLRPSSTVAGSSRLIGAARRLVLGERVESLSGLETDAVGLAAAAHRLAARSEYLVWGVPSAIARLAREAVEGGIALRRPPRVIIASGETLTAGDAVLIQRTFRCPVVNHYSTYEILHLAQTCPANAEVLHVNSERAILRVVRDDGSDAAPGEAGRIVITDLGNWVMPFINYDVGDWATAGAPCPCGRGFPTIARVEGRVGETIRTGRGRIVSPAGLGWFLAYVSGAMPYVSEYQAVLVVPRALVLRIVPTPRFTREFARKLEADLEEFLGPGFAVRTETTDRIEAEPSGKRLLVKTEGPRTV